jgi:hypothetical protein
MMEGDVFDRVEKFADVDFNSERLGKRFRRTMEALSKDPRKSIYGTGANRAEAKAICNLLGDDKFDKGEIPLSSFPGVKHIRRDIAKRRMKANLVIICLKIHEC